MSQNNLFSQTFQPQSQQLYEPGLYPTDLQFAASVPHSSQAHLPMNFQQPPYQSPESMLSGMQSYPNSPYERLDSLVSAGGTGRPLQTKAERRAEHNATERARRENLNAKFQQLAHALPNLQNESRQSKVTIIDRTLDYVKGSIVKEEQMKKRIKELEKINGILLSQLDDRSCKRKKSVQMNSVPSPRSEPLDKQRQTAPSHCSVSPISVASTPRTTQANHWPNKNSGFTENVKQEQLAFYDFEGFYTMMPMYEKDVSSLIDQRQFVSMPVIDQRQSNANFYDLMQRQ